MNETDGKGTISKVGYLFDNPASFRKLEIEPNAFLNSHGQAAPWCEGVQGQGIGERLEFSLKKTIHMPKYSANKKYLFQSAMSIIPAPIYTMPTHGRKYFPSI